MTADQLDELIARAKARYGALTPEQKKVHDDAQRASFVRGMQPCQHGRVDFEQCPDCRAMVRAGAIGGVDGSPLSVENENGTR